MLKKSTLLRKVICLTLIVLFILPAAVFATDGADEEKDDGQSEAVPISFGVPREIIDEPLVLADLNVSIWPEYDKSETLVIYSGVLRNDSRENFMGRLKFFVPSRSEMLLGKAEMVCETEVGMKCIQYDIREMEDGFGELTWTPTTTIGPGKTFPFMLEFYYDPLDGDVEKTFTYDLLSYYNVENLVISVKPPIDADSFAMNPTAQWDGIDEDGFTSYYTRSSNVPAGETVALSAQYRREASGPSYVEDSNKARQAARSVGVSQISGPIQWMLAFFILVVGGFVFYAVKIAPNSGDSGKKNKKRGKNAKTVRTGKGSSAARNGRKVTSGKKSADSVDRTSSAATEKKKARRALLEGKISEETYNEMIEDIENEE